MPAATTPATCFTFVSSAAVNGAPTPATSYWKMPMPGVQYARRYRVFGFLKV